MCRFPAGHRRAPGGRARHTGDGSLACRGGGVLLPVHPPSCLSPSPMQRVLGGTLLPVHLPSCPSPCPVLTAPGVDAPPCLSPRETRSAPGYPAPHLHTRPSWAPSLLAFVQGAQAAISPDMDDGAGDTRLLKDPAALRCARANVSCILPAPLGSLPCPLGAAGR